MRTACIALLLSSLSGEMTACPSGYSAYSDTTCFKIHTSPQSVPAARASCKEDGGALAMIQDAEQNEYVRKLKQDLGLPWVTIGLTSEGNADDSCWY